MVSATEENIQHLLTTAQLIAKEALQRSWRVWLLRQGASHMCLERPDGKKLEIYSSLPPTTSAVAYLRARNKYFTHSQLKEHELPVLSTYEANDVGTAVNCVKDIATNGGECVVKPASAAHGDGVTVGVSEAKQAKEAIDLAFEYSKTIVVQEYYKDAIDLRIVYMGGKIACMFYRLPARVQGDGVHSVGELIEQENASDRRGEYYEKEFNKIDMDAAKRFLGDALHSVPAEGEWIRSMGAANIGVGGEAIEAENVPLWLRQMAREACNVLELQVGAVDFLISRMAQPDDTRDALSPAIIEVNAVPVLLKLEVKAYLDYLELLD